MHLLSKFALLERLYISTPPASMSAPNQHRYRNEAAGFVFESSDYCREARDRVDLTHGEPCLYRHSDPRPPRPW